MFFYVDAFFQHIVCPDRRTPRLRRGLGTRGKTYKLQCQGSRVKGSRALTVMYCVAD